MSVVAVRTSHCRSSLCGRIVREFLLASLMTRDCLATALGPATNDALTDRDPLPPDSRWFSVQPLLCLCVCPNAAA